MGPPCNPKPPKKDANAVDTTPAEDLIIDTDIIDVSAVEPLLNLESRFPFAFDEHSEVGDPWEIDDPWNQALVIPKHGCRNPACSSDNPHRPPSDSKLIQEADLDIECGPSNLHMCSICLQAGVLDHVKGEIGSFDWDELNATTNKFLDSVKNITTDPRLAAPKYAQ